jgi:hypothetical protein
MQTISRDRNWAVECEPFRKIKKACHTGGSTRMGSPLKRSGTMVCQRSAKNQSLTEKNIVNLKPVACKVVGEQLFVVSLE